jgi:hypothetical protein
MILGRIIAFATMFVFVFIVLIAAACFIPFLLVFVAWDMSVLNINWDLVYYFLRLNVLLSIVVATLFTFSKEGK